MPVQTNVLRSPSARAEKAQKAPPGVRRNDFLLDFRVGFRGLAFLWRDACPAGALASTVCRVRGADIWHTLGDFLHRFPEVHSTLAASSHLDSGPGCPTSFFRRSLEEFGPSVLEVKHGNQSTFELIALVLDSFSNEACHRVTRGPGPSFLCLRDSAPLAGPSGRAWSRVARFVEMWDGQAPVSAEDMGRSAVKVEKQEEQIRSLAMPQLG